MVKVSQVSENIIKVHMKVGITISAWVVKHENGSIIIDTGIRPMAPRILKEAARFGRVQMILLTHGHPDHVGGLAYIQDRVNAPVYIHGLEIPYITGEKPYPNRKKPTDYTKGFSVKQLPGDSRGVFHSMMGIDPYFTPGHSPGHTAYYHKKDDVLITGDMITSKNGRIGPPMKQFTANMDRAMRSTKTIQKVAPGKLSICHGEDLEYSQHLYSAFVNEYQSKV